jgi:hypothetical protein
MEELAVARATEAITGCRQVGSNAEISVCYGKILNELKVEVQQAQNRRKKDLSVLSPKNSGGSRNVLRFQRAARDLDIHWNAIIALECGPLIEAEFYGAQGQGLFAKLCQINIVAARLDSLTAARR